MRRIENIKNFGPSMVKTLNQIGIYTEDDLLSTDYITIQKTTCRKPYSAAFTYFSTLLRWAFRTEYGMIFS